MKIDLLNIGKRFNNDWIFRKINYSFSLPDNYAILGANGSGKSTLLLLLSGKIHPSEGTTAYYLEENTIAHENIYQYVSIAAPYQELIEEFTLKEMLSFHLKFKQSIERLEVKGIIDILGQKKFMHRPLKYFSSGMKQRVKLAIALLSNTPLVLLDEPLTNLDPEGFQWYRKLIEDFGKNRLILVCSNKQEQEYFFCDQFLQIEDYKSD